MKIIYHHRTLGDGAEGIHIAEMVNAFRELGHEVHVVSPIGGQTNMTNDRVNCMARLKKIIPSICYEVMELSYNLYGYYLLHKAIVKFRPDFIYDRYITFNASSIFASRHFKIPIILEVNSPLAFERGNESDEKLHLNRIAHRLERWICTHAYKTVVVSTPLKQYLINIGVPEEKIVVLPNGVNLKKFQPDNKDQALLDQMGIPPKHIVLGFVGILRPWHGLDFLLDSFAQLAKSMNNVHLLLIGDGPIRSDLEKKIFSLNLAHRVKISGRISHECIPRYINVIDIAVSPMATFYASPMKILEYMALKKPVIAPNTQNIRDIITDGREGMLFTPGDSHSLCSAMQKLALDEELRITLGYNARVKVETERNWLTNAKSIVSLVQ